MSSIGKSIEIEIRLVVVSGLGGGEWGLGVQGEDKEWVVIKYEVSCWVMNIFWN